MIETCRALAPRRSAVPLTLTELRRKGEWIMIALERPAALVALAETIVTSLGPLHAPGLAPPSWLAPDDAERRAHFARFGSPNIGSLYAPHVTIARVEPASRLDGRWAEAATQPLARTRVDGAARALSVALADEDGQFLESLATFELRPASGAE